MRALVKRIFRRRKATCSVCGRRLLSRKSIERGMGPTCSQKYQGGLQKELEERHGQLRLFG